jgi:phenylacetate-coenzyme A ligase PaaK-like adenylate-forming protein
MEATARMTNEREDYEATRRRHAEYANGLLPELVARISWPRERIEAEQTRALRAIVRHAKEHSPWHRERLRGVDPDSITTLDVERIPPMTKSDLMANWDAIVTDRRATLAAAEAHLERLTADAYFLDDHHVIASGGSTGTRGVFLYDWHGWAVTGYGLLRGLFAVARKLGLATPSPGASVAAYAATHASSALAQTFSSPALSLARFPVSLPLADVVAGLNRVQPVLLHGYGSMLAILAAEAAAGRLRIAPRIVWSTSEPLLPEAHDAVEAAWRATVLDAWATSESNGAAFPCEAAPGFHVGDDLGIVEPIDDRGAPVPAGTRSAKILLTNLYNRIQPILRYEVSDEFLFAAEPCACGSKHAKVLEVGGRADDVFRYPGGAAVHPITFRSPLGREPAIVEYQVRQTATGAEVYVVARGVFDAGGLALKVRDALARVGVPAPEVSVRAVDAIPRLATGKLKRFVPLDPAASNPA